MHSRNPNVPALEVLRKQFVFENDCNFLHNWFTRINRPRERYRTYLCPDSLDIFRVFTLAYRQGLRNVFGPFLQRSKRLRIRPVQHGPELGVIILDGGA